MQWTKDLFSKYITLKEDGKVVCLIKNDSWSSFASVEFDGEKYGFYKKGFFTTTISIAHIPSGISVGSIHNKYLESLVRVKFKDETYNWKKEGFLSSKFYMRKGEETIISYVPKFSDGTIVTKVEDKLLVATGMYIFLNNQASIAALIIIMSVIFLVNR